MAPQVSPIAIAIVLVAFWTAPAAHGTTQELQALLPQPPATAPEANLALPSCRIAASAAPCCGLDDTGTDCEASDMTEKGQNLQKAADWFRFPHKGVIEVRNPVLVGVQCIQCYPTSADTAWSSSVVDSYHSWLNEVRKVARVHGTNCWNHALVAQQSQNRWSRLRTHGQRLSPVLLALLQTFLRFELELSTFWQQDLPAALTMQPSTSPSLWPEELPQRIAYIYLDMQVSLLSS